MLFIILFAFAASFVVFAAECGTKKLTDVVDSSTWSTDNYEDNWWRARQAMCGTSDPCFDGSVACSVQIIMDETNTLQLSRSSQNPTPDFSTCWDGVADIITQCLRGSKIAEGSWTLPSSAYQYSVISTTPQIQVAISQNDAQQAPLQQAPQCSDCGSGGNSNGKCKGGFFDGQYCCGTTPGDCGANGCNGSGGACTGNYLGCPCTNGKSAPTGTPTSCSADCCGTVLDANWCIANCKGYYGTNCGLCVCG